ncbi:MAG: carboxypeptidase regulatory-like domain-containing protein [Ruminococcaceae bacterium]|nr:carboxypeptidase regulatory-like domain-containing protein [Oscillospiraceae bacterium]
MAQYSPNTGGSLQEMIDRYSRELMQFREKTEEIERNPQPQELAQLREELERLERELERIRQNAEGQPQVGGISDMSDAAPPVSTNGTAQLKVVVYAADEAIPIQGANVIITSVGGDEIYKTAVTDENGQTPEIELPAVEVSGSNQQNNPDSYTEYRVSISADGYIPQERIASLVATTSATLPVAMTPRQVFSGREMM